LFCEQSDQSGETKEVELMTSCTPVKPLRVLSLGAGVQSSCVALMIAAGELPMVDCAIFADTQWEPKKVYLWLDWLEKQLPFPVYRVTAGDLRANVLESKNTTGSRFASIPWFILDPKGKEGMGRRQCTS
jgi:3'-phosphoadenosine 5'-phosphosulfate sulfotransferase (PAPS reductase)/FAD synthetase